jgi:hypothetical protein
MKTTFQFQSAPTLLGAPVLHSSIAEGGLASSRRAITRQNMQFLATHKFVCQKSATIFKVPESLLAAPAAARRGGLFGVMRNFPQQMNQFYLGFFIFHLVAGVNEAGGFVRREGGLNPAGIFFIQIGADLQNLASEFRDFQEDKDMILDELFDLGGVDFSAKPAEVNSESFSLQDGIPAETEPAADQNTQQAGHDRNEDFFQHRWVSLFGFRIGLIPGCCELLDLEKTPPSSCLLSKIHSFENGQPAFQPQNSQTDHESGGRLQRRRSNERRATWPFIFERYDDGGGNMTLTAAGQINFLNSTAAILPDSGGNGGTTLMLQASDNGTPMYLHVTSAGIATWTTSP